MADQATQVIRIPTPVEMGESEQEVAVQVATTKTLGVPTLMTTATPTLTTPKAVM